MKDDIFKLMTEVDGYPCVEMDDLSEEDAEKEKAHYQKLFPENNYWIEPSSGSVEAPPLRFIPRGAADGHEDLYPYYD